MERRLRVLRYKFVIHSRFGFGILVFTVLLAASFLPAAGQNPPAPSPAAPAPQTPTVAPAPAPAPEVIEKGSSVFAQHCAFCHGRDAGGGENGPDLTRSKLVEADVAGDKIAPVVRSGRMENGMPAFSLPDTDIAGLAAFIHDRKIKAATRKGGRRGVDVADLQTGDAERGKQYFNGAGGCASCHSPTGDLAGVARRYDGLKLEQQMLYPRGVKSKITVTLPSGQSIPGELAYRDEFTVGVRDSLGRYHSYSAKRVKYTIDAPVEAHAEQLPKYTDADIHDLMAYLQTLR
jgi:cytochrome c oxidase cbb3-type subunit 3